MEHYFVWTKTTVILLNFVLKSIKATLRHFHILLTMLTNSDYVRSNFVNPSIAKLSLSLHYYLCIAIIF